MARNMRLCRVCAARTSMWNMRKFRKNPKKMVASVKPGQRGHMVTLCHKGAEPDALQTLKDCLKLRVCILQMHMRRVVKP